MKAVIIQSDGFRKYIDVDKKSQVLYGLHPIAVEIFALEKRPITDLIDVHKVAYEFIREYEDEFDNKILIYREMQ